VRLLHLKTALGASLNGFADPTIAFPVGYVAGSDTTPPFVCTCPDLQVGDTMQMSYTTNGVNPDDVSDVAITFTSDMALNDGPDAAAWGTGPFANGVTVKWKIRYGRSGVFSNWSNILSDTVNVGFTPDTLFAVGDVGYTWNPTDLTKVWQSIAGTTAGAFGSPVGRLADISGQGNNLNATADNFGRPTLVNVSNGMVSFDGANDQLLGIAGFYAKGAMTWVGAIKGLDSGAHVLWAENSSSLSVPSYSPALRANANTTQMLNFQKNNAGAQIANAMAVPLMDNAIHVYFVVDTGTQVQVSIDGGAFVTNAYVRSGVFTMDISSFGTSNSAGTNLGGFAAYNLGAGCVIGRNLTGVLGTAGTERTNLYNWVASKHGLPTL
jgi:hypothetical protein